MLMLCMLRCGNWAVEVADGASPQLPSPPRSLGAAHRLALVSTTPASRRLLFFGKVTSTDEELSSGVLDTFVGRFFSVQERHRSSNRAQNLPHHCPHGEGGACGFAKS